MEQNLHLSVVSSTLGNIRRRDRLMGEGGGLEALLSMIRSGSGSVGGVAIMRNET